MGKIEELNKKFLYCSHAHVNFALNKHNSVGAIQ